MNDSTYWHSQSDKGSGVCVMRKQLGKLNFNSDQFRLFWAFGWPLIVALMLLPAGNVYWSLGVFAFGSFAQVTRYAIKHHNTHIMWIIVRAIVFGAASGAYYYSGNSEANVVRNATGVGVVVLILFLLPLVPWRRLMSQKR